MRAGAGQPLGDSRDVAEAVVWRLEQHESTDLDPPCRCTPFRRARDREQHRDPRHAPTVDDAR
jgi:hypothetical protein